MYSSSSSKKSRIFALFFIKSMLLTFWKNLNYENLGTINWFIKVLQIVNLMSYTVLFISSFIYFIWSRRKSGHLSNQILSLPFPLLVLVLLLKLEWINITFGNYYSSIVKVNAFMTDYLKIVGHLTLILIDTDRKDY